MTGIIEIDKIYNSRILDLSLITDQFFRIICAVKKTIIGKICGITRIAIVDIKINEINLFSFTGAGEVAER
jgi:hypothetical protein